MNIKDIKALAAVLRQADLTKLDYSEGDVRITLERTAPSIVAAAPQPAAEPVTTTRTTTTTTTNARARQVPKSSVKSTSATPAPAAKK